MIGSITDETRENLKEASKTAKYIKTSKYSLGKNPENLTESQEARLEFVTKVSKKLFKAYSLKERLRYIFKIGDPDEA